jgi:hypothetical protein
MADRLSGIQENIQQRGFLWRFPQAAVLLAGNLIAG